MKKFLSILALALSCMVIFTCDNGDPENPIAPQKIAGSAYFVQSTNLKSLDITCIILENGWNNGKIQACYDYDYYYDPGTIAVYGSNVTISELSNRAASLNGSWDYEYDREYDVHILRKGSEYVIFW